MQRRRDAGRTSYFVVSLIGRCARTLIAGVPRFKSSFERTFSMTLGRLTLSMLCLCCETARGCKDIHLFFKFLGAFGRRAGNLRGADTWKLGHSTWICGTCNCSCTSVAESFAACMRPVTYCLYLGLSLEPACAPLCHLLHKGENMTIRMHAYIMHACMHKYINTYIHTYIHTYIRTYVRTYIHTYIHVDVHTYRYTCIHYIHYGTIHYTFHSIPLHYITTYYITLPYINTSIHPCMHTYVHKTHTRKRTY